MELSEKQKTFPEFSAEFFKSRFKLEHFGKKDDPDRICIPEITNSENVVR